MIRYLAGASMLALMSGGLAHAQDHEDVTLYRVFVGDHAAPRVTVIDLEAHGDGAPETWTFDTTGQVKLFGVAGGAVVAAVQSDDDAVHFLSSGITVEDHGDHADIKVAPPAAIDKVLTGARPFHVVDHGGSVIINHDLGGYAEILDAGQLAKGLVKVTRLPQSVAHHGFVARLGDHWLTTVAPPAPTDGSAAAPRLGLQEVSLSGEPVGDLATCTAIHGEAFSGAFLAAGCREGVLTATLSPEGVVYNMLEYPADLPQDVTTGTLLGAAGMQVFLGNHGATGLVVIDPVDAPHFRRIELPFRRVDFVLDPARPDAGYVLTEDGTLHRINLLDASIAVSAKVTAPYSMDGHWNDPRPRLAMAGEDIVLTDPGAGLLRVISAQTLTEERTIAVAGTPYNLTVIGGSGLTH